MKFLCGTGKVFIRGSLNTIQRDSIFFGNKIIAIKEYFEYIAQQRHFHEYGMETKNNKTIILYVYIHVKDKSKVFFI